MTCVRLRLGVGVAPCARPGPGPSGARIRPQKLGQNPPYWHWQGALPQRRVLLAGCWGLPQGVKGPSCPRAGCLGARRGLCDLTWPPEAAPTRSRVSKPDARSSRVDTAPAGWLQGTSSLLCSARGVTGAQLLGRGGLVWCSLFWGISTAQPSRIWNPTDTDVSHATFRVVPGAGLVTS